MFWTVLASIITAIILTVTPASGQDLGQHYQDYDPTASFAHLTAPRFVGDSEINWGPASHIRMQATDHPEAVAELEFLNGMMHPHSGDNGPYTLTHDGISISIVANTGFGNRPDYIDIETPEGYIATPNPLVVEEEQTGVAYIIPIGGEMM